MNEHTNILGYLCGEVTDLKNICKRQERVIRKTKRQTALLWLGLIGISCVTAKLVEGNDILKAKIAILEDSMKDNGTFSTHYDDEVEGD